MKRITLLPLLATIILCSCVKDDDFDALGHDFEITGQFHPFLGFPIGSSDMDIADLLGRWQETAAMVTCDPNTQFVTFVYSDSFDGTIDFHSSKKTSPNRVRQTDVRDFPSVEDSVITIKEHFSGTLDIDIFNQIDNIDLIGANVTLKSLLKGYGKPNAPSLMQQFKLHPWISGVTVTVVGANGNTVLTPTVDNDSITVEELIAGKELLLADKEDLSDCFRTKPQRIQYDLDLNISYRVSEMTAAIISNPNSFVLDSIMLDSIATTTSIDANFPVQIKTHQFSYEMEMDMSFESIESALEDFREHIALGDSAYIALRFLNSMPLSFQLNDILYDEHDNPILDNQGQPIHLYSTNESIKAATLKDTVVNGTHYSISNSIPIESIFKTNVSDDILDQIVRTRKMHLIVTLTSGSLPSGTEPQHVTIRSNDRLKTYLYFVTNPKTIQ